MKKLSSDFLFYKGLIGFIIGPIVIVLFIKYIMADQSYIFKDFFYFLLLIMMITQVRLIYKTRRILYDGTNLFLKNYFIKDLEEVKIINIISLKKAFSLQREVNKKLFKLTYIKNDKAHTVYFFKASELYNVDNLEIYIGVNINVIPS